jgi:predicted MFS family arabinose efflux permease
MIAAPLVANLIVDYGWRKTYQALGLTSVAITLVTAVLLVRNAPATTMAHTNTAGDSFAEALRSSGYRKLLVAFALLGAVSSAVLVHQATLLLEAGHSMREVGVLQGTVGAAAIVGRLGVGWLLDRVSIRWIMPPVLLAASAGCAVLGANATGIFVPISAATLGLMLGAEMDVLGYMIRRNHGSRSFGALYGLVFAIFSLGSGLGAAAVGRLHDVYDGYNIPFLGLALILVVVAAIFTNASFARRPS